MAVRASDRVTLVKVADFSYQRAYYLLQNSTLPTPAAPTTNPPAAPWSTQEPTYTPGATVSLYRVELGVWGDGSFQYGPVQLDSKYEAAKGAYNAAAAAQGTANTALTTADGKNTIVRSVNVAGGASAYKAGDQWWQFSGANIIATWIHDGSLWINYKMAHQILGSVDATTITTGFLSAAILAARSVTIDKLLITSMDNFIQDAGFEANTTAAWNITGSASNVATNPRTGARALSIVTTSSAFMAAQTPYAVRVEPGEQYRVGMWIRNATGTSGQNPIAMRFNTGATEASTPIAEPDLWLGRSDGDFSYTGVTTTYGRVSGVWTVPAGVKFARLGIVSRDVTAGRTYYIDDIEMVKMASGQLIVDGAIDGKTITGATIRTAADGQRLQLDSFGLRSYDATGNVTSTLYASSGGMQMTGTLSVGGGLLGSNFLRLGSNAYSGPYSSLWAYENPDGSTELSISSIPSVAHINKGQARIFLHTEPDSGTGKSYIEAQGELRPGDILQMSATAKAILGQTTTDDYGFGSIGLTSGKVSGTPSFRVGGSMRNGSMVHDATNRAIQAADSADAPASLTLNQYGGDVNIGQNGGAGTLKVNNRPVPTDSGWVNITGIGGGWEPGTDSEQPRVRKIGSRVDLIGKVNRISTGQTGAIMNIPVGFRTAFTSGNSPAGFAMTNDGNAIMLYINNSTNNIFISVGWTTKGSLASGAQINFMCSWYAD